MRKPLLVLSALLGASLLVASLAVADVKLAAVISDGMVLQRDIQVPIWGTDEPGREVTVTFRDQRVSVIADAEGRWMVRLKALEAGGLVAKGGPRLKGFTMAGPDRKFFYGNGHIDRDTVVVSSAAVRNPVAVRYAWADNPLCNLYNKAGLPASPFRTDDWPGITAKQR